MKIILDQHIRKISCSMKRYLIFILEHSTFLKTSHWGLYISLRLIVHKFVPRVSRNEG